jgi:endonuclease/exonuclease/phosphatase family metal-dependent hydrolase
MILILNFVIPGGVFGQSGTSGGGTKVEESGGSDDSDADSTDSEGAGTPITFVSWNSLFDNPNNVGTITKNLLKTYDVVGLQEVHETSQRNNIQAIKSATIGVYMNEDSGKYVPSYPIIYNKSKLTIVKTGFSKLGNSPDGLRPKYSIYARFRINATKQEFYFVNTHLLKYVENNGKVYDDEHPEHVSAYKKMIAKLKEQLISLKSSGVPVVIVGDFAVNYRRDACTVSWWPCATMHSMSIKSSYEHTKLAGISSSQNTYGAGSRLIDYVFVSASNDTKVTSTTILSGGGSNYQGSDHRPVTASVTFLSSSGAD